MFKHQDRKGKLGYERFGRRPPPYELGLAVTVGVAVKPRSGDFIVTVSDQRQSFQDYFQPVDDGQIKVARIAKCWGFLFAGVEAGYATTVQRRAYDLLGGRAAMMQEKTFEEITEAMTTAYQLTVADLALYKFLRRYGFADMAEFRRLSFQQLGNDATKGLMKKIDDFKLGMDCLVFGFDPIGVPRFLVITDEEVIDRTASDAWAVGSGTYLALGAHHARPFDDDSVEPNVYRACEAKFCAEMADGVGKNTSAYIWYPNGKFGVISTEYLDKLRHVWETDRRRPIPEGADKIIGDALHYDAEFRARSLIRPLPLPDPEDA